MNKQNYIPDNDKERDPFLEEAMEGWEQFPNARMKWLKTKTRFSLFLFGKSWSWLPAGTKWLVGSIAAASTVTIITVSTVLINNTSQPIMQQHAVNDNNELIEEMSSTEDSVFDEETAVLTAESEESTKDNTEIPVESFANVNEDEITTDNIISTSDNTPRNNNASTTNSAFANYNLSGYDMADEDITMDKLDVKKMETLVAPSDDRSVATLPWLYVHDFKIVDYDILRTEIDQPVMAVNKSLNSRYSSAAEKEKRAEEDKVINYDTIPYKQYLASALLMIKQQNYPEAERQLKILAQKYPEDENVIFYTGFMYYEQGSFILAIPYFEKSMNSTYKAFATDAEWLLGNALLSMGKTQEACSVFQTIVSKNNYYSKDARKLLKRHDHE